MIAPRSLRERFLRATDRPRSAVESEDMEWFGIRNLMLAAKAYNLLRDGRTYAYRRRLYRSAARTLMTEAGAGALDMRDGYAIDPSRSNPTIDAAIEAAEDIIAQRGMTRRGMPGRGFIRDLLAPEDLTTHPALLDFATSPSVLATVSAYMSQVPVLSTTVPPAIRLTESSVDGQDPDGYRVSQLYHLDFHDFRAVYVILLLRDSTPDSGPFTFLGAEASARVSRRLGYRRRHAPYHLDDAQVHSVIDPAEAMPFIAPRGTILFIDSNRCLHFGSRDAHTTRYQLMCAYVSPCRTDFTERRLDPVTLPTAPGDSPLRRLLLDRHQRLA